MSRGRILKGLFLILVLGAGIQLVPVKRTNPPVTSKLQAPAAVDSLLRRACYDCHSHETRWPWYSHVAPMSWMVIHHVNEGRENLNFSTWPEMDFERQDQDMDDMWTQVRGGHMPLRSYLWIHHDARLNDADMDVLRTWAGR